MSSNQTTRRLALCAGFALAILHSTAVGQRADAKALQQRLDDKLSNEWVGNAEWITDFDKAKAEAKRRGKQIFGYFTRSYAP